MLVRLTDLPRRSAASLLMLALATPPSSAPPRRPEAEASGSSAPRPMTEADLTFVAPEGVYSIFEDHKPTGHTINASPGAYPTRLTTVTVRYPPSRSGSQGLVQLLGVNRETKAAKAAAAAAAEINDGAAPSESSSDTEASPDPHFSNPDAATPVDQQATLFSPHSAAPGKRRAVARPKHNMRTTSSTFITRLQTTESMLKALQTKTGDVCFLFYNSAKSFFWTEVGIKTKVDYSCKLLRARVSPMLTVIS
jgi:catabolite repression protein CreC